MLCEFASKPVSRHGTASAAQVIHVHVAESEWRSTYVLALLSLESAESQRNQQGPRGATFFQP